MYNINLGVKRPQISDKHWIYFPEKKYAFYRVGFPMNFAPAMTPPDCSSMYVEVAHQPQHPVDEKKVMRDTLRGLKDCGLIESEKDIISTCILKIPMAYVTYDANRTACTKRILALSGIQTRLLHRPLRRLEILLHGRSHPRRPANRGEDP